MKWLAEILMTLVGVQSIGQQVYRIAWDVSAGAVGYRVYCGPASGYYTNIVSVGPTNSVALVLPSGSTYLAATALGSDGEESGYSNEIRVQGARVLRLYCLSATNVSGPFRLAATNALLSITNPTGSQVFRLEIREETL